MSEFLDASTENPSPGSTWFCELCQVEVWVRHQPQRQRCKRCRKWMVRTRLVYPRIVSTDVDGLCCKPIEQADLQRVKRTARP